VQSIFKKMEVILQRKYYKSKKYLKVFRWYCWL